MLSGAKVERSNFQGNFDGDNSVKLKGKDFLNFVLTINDFFPFLEERELREIENFYIAAKEYERALVRLIEGKVFTSVRQFQILCSKKDKRTMVKNMEEAYKYLEKQKLIMEFWDKVLVLCSTELGKEYFEFPLKDYENIIGTSIFSFLKKIHSLGFSIFVPFKDFRNIPAYLFLTVEGFLFMKFLKNFAMFNPLIFSHVSLRLEELFLIFIKGMQKVKDFETLLYGLMVVAFPVLVFNKTEPQKDFDTLKQKIYYRNFYRKRIISAMLESEKNLQNEVEVRH